MLLLLTKPSRVTLLCHWKRRSRRHLPSRTNRRSPHIPLLLSLWSLTVQPLVTYEPEYNNFGTRSMLKDPAMWTLKTNSIRCLTDWKTRPWKQVTYSQDEYPNNISLGSLNQLQDLLRQAHDHPDRFQTTGQESILLQQCNQPFTMYLALFQHLIGGLRWNDEDQCTQLYKDLSEDIKEELVHYLDAGNNLAGCIKQ